MTETPRLPACAARDADGSGAEATSAELDRMTELALYRGARFTAIGRGRSAEAARTAEGFARRWEAAGRVVLDIVTWPEDAASWLRQATRLAAADPDLWIMTGAPRGWAQVTRRLLWSTTWRPERTIASAALGTERAIGLVGACNLEGLAGATAVGGAWAIAGSRLTGAADSPGAAG
jgi:hypothetical protein